MANILIVEDDEKIRKMLTLRLKLKGHTIEQAENGKVGVDKALAGNFDAIMMDMHMPVMDGHEAAETLRNADYQGLIIAVTASVMSSETDTAIQSGCNNFIAKPIGADFEELVENCINNFKAE